MDDPTGWGGVIAGFGDQRELELLVEAVSDLSRPSRLRPTTERSSWVKPIGSVR